MPLHLKKLCVGPGSVDELANSIERRADSSHSITGKPYIWITTRSRPKRDAEILGQGSSLYWIINRLICVRQEILAFRPGVRTDGKSCIHIDLDYRLTLVTPRPHRPFQGWRYLEGNDAPADLLMTAPKGDQADDLFPPAMTRELANLGLI